jgi:hypothetical protein
LQEIGNQLASIVENSFAGFASLIDAQISKQNELVAAQQRVVDETARQLEEEKKLKDQGYANNFDALQGQLQAETELLQREEEKRLALEKKAATLRLRQEALQTASNIALSVTKVLAAESGKGLLGIITAAAGIASIFALVAKAKAQAAAFSKPEKLRKGKRLEGATHEQGGVDLLVSGESGGRQLYEAERGEWLIGTQPSKEHDSFLERLNDNEFSGQNLNKHVDFAADFFADPANMIKDLAPTYGVPLLPDAMAALLPSIRKASRDAVASKSERERSAIIAAFGIYSGEVSGGMRRVEKAIREQPLAIPLTEKGYMIKKTTGNTETTTMYETPKRP